MLKRKTEGGGGEATESAVQPIPRHIPQRSITLNFYQNTWEEVAPGKLYYLPLCQNPKYMFDQAMRAQFGKFTELWGTMEIHQPKVRISNLIMLQDDLRVQNNTPTDATAFTQVVYMLKFCPQAMKQYFGLGSLQSEDMKTVKHLTYKLEPIKAETTNPTQLITINDYEDFERLTVHGAKSNYTAGFISGKAPDVEAETYRLIDPYIAPNAGSSISAFSGNLNIAEKGFLDPGSTITMARNLNSKHYYKYGEVIDIPIVTNLNGVHLYNTRANNFLEEQTITLEDKGKSITYEGEFCWPSRNRPFLSRSNYFDNNTDPIIHGKEFKQLEHCFLTMPPIRKPNGALLGQRCSFTMEQSMAITFHFPQASFLDETEDEAALMNQDNSVVIRRNVYGVPDVKLPPESIFCAEAPMECKVEFSQPSRKKIRKDKHGHAADKCYEDSFAGLAKFFAETPDALEEWSFCYFFSAASSAPSDAYVVGQAEWGNYPLLDLTKMDLSTPLKAYWHQCIKNKTDIKLYWFSGKITEPPTDATKHYVYMSYGSDINRFPLVRMGTDVPFNNLLTIRYSKFLETSFFKRSSNVCPIAQKAVKNKLCNVFFT